MEHISSSIYQTNPFESLQEGPEKLVLSDRKITLRSLIKGRKFNIRGRPANKKNLVNYSLSIETDN